MIAGQFGPDANAALTLVIFAALTTVCRDRAVTPGLRLLPGSIPLAAQRLAPLGGLVLHVGRRIRCVLYCVLRRDQPPPPPHANPRILAPSRE